MPLTYHVNKLRSSLLNGHELETEVVLVKMITKELNLGLLLLLLTLFCFVLHLRLFLFSVTVCFWIAFNNCYCRCPFLRCLSVYVV